jgi:hypothetical protein
LWAEWLQKDVLATVPHRHVVLTMPRLASRLAPSGLLGACRRGDPVRGQKGIEDVACYMVRAPLSLKKLVYLDGQKAVLYRSRMNPFLGRNFEAMDPLEWLARLADHIPDTGKHRTHSYGFYASRVRASRREKEGSELPVEAAPTKRRCPPSRARLISKVGAPVAQDPSHPRFGEDEEKAEKAEVKS